ncbi:MAG TPA: adenosine deaminase [Candidatus Saccharimonadales bacterium]
MKRTKLQTSGIFPNYPLAELHAHLGTSISPAILWQIAHSLGIKLPQDEYEDFCKYITLSADRPMQLNDYFSQIYHPILDRLSSGTHAVEAAAYHTMSGAYRSNGITLMELRTNPMKHNRNAEVDLDHLIMAMLRGMERALLEHKRLSAGLIFCIAREFDVDQNAIIIEKAIKYHKRGIVGIDVAGPANKNFQLKDYAKYFQKARKAGLGITVHSGEVQAANDIWEALEHLNPSRIGHGVLAAYDKPLMKELAKRKVVLEVCPMSNLATKAVENIDEMKFILRTLIENKVSFTINTDWPEIIEDCRLRSQYKMLVDNDLLNEEELKHCTQIGFGATFIPRKGGLEAYL